MATLLVTDLGCTPLPELKWIPCRSRASDGNTSCPVQVKAYGCVSRGHDGKPDCLHIEMAEKSSLQMLQKFTQLEDIADKKYIYVINCDTKGTDSMHSSMISATIKDSIIYQSIKHSNKKNVVVSWNGLMTWPGSIIHQALKGVGTETMHSERKGLKRERKEIFSIAYLSWDDVDGDIRETLETHGKVDKPLCPDAEENPLGDSVSPHLTHFVLLSVDAKERKDVYTRVLLHLSNSLQSLHEDKMEGEFQAVAVCFDGGEMSIKIASSLYRILPVFIIEEIKGCPLWNDIRLSTRYNELNDIFQFLAKFILGQSYDDVIFSGLFFCKTNSRIFIRDWLFYVTVLRYLRKDNTKDVFKEKERLDTLFKEEFAFYVFVAMVIHDKTEAVHRLLKEYVAPRLQFKQSGYTYIWKHLDVRTLLLLYNSDKMKTVTKRKNEVTFLHEIREIQENIMQKVMRANVLRCAGRECHCCQDYRKAKLLEERTGILETYKMRSCLHPVQELFIWWLIAGEMDFALALWTLLDNKVAAALVARATLMGVSKCRSVGEELKKEKDVENSGRFQELAIAILTEYPEEHMASLLLYQNEWWGGLSVLQLAFESGNKEFMAQPTCKRQMTNIWRCADYGMVPSKTERTILPRFYSTNSLSSQYSRRGLHLMSRTVPVHRYTINLVLQLLFLGMFTKVMLFESGREMTVSFLFVIVWMVITTLEEIRQILSPLTTAAGHSMAPNGVQERGTQSPIRLRVKRYVSDFWNIIDIAVSVIFWTGMMNFSNNESVHVTGRILLSLDLCLAYLRMLQMLMVFEKLGLMLVMVGEMSKSTVYFMIILMVAVISYAVASEAILYPDTERALASLFYLPRKAYWQVFGELFLDEIEGVGIKNCLPVLNTSQTSNSDMLKCPSKHGRYVVQVLLGLYIVFTNVLLLNLLIAQFNQTYNQVLNEASETQFWHKCKLIVEYKYVMTLPPPLNLIQSFFKLCRLCCSKKATRHSVRAQWLMDSNCLQMYLCGLQPAKCSDGHPVNGFIIHAYEKDCKVQSHLGYKYTIFTNQHSKYAALWDLQPLRVYEVTVLCSKTGSNPTGEVKMTIAATVDRDFYRGAREEFNVGNCIIEKFMKKGWKFYSNENQNYKMDNLLSNNMEAQMEASLKKIEDKIEETLKRMEERLENKLKQMEEKLEENKMAAKVI